MALALADRNALSIKLIWLMKNLFSLMPVVLLDFMMFYFTMSSLC